MYTDLNGLQFQKRKYRGDRPIQFNYYPITSTAFIQSETTRFSVHTRQAMGAASLVDGSIELMLDRILGQDDNRGLGQPVQDNLPLVIPFLLMHETIASGKLGRELSPIASRASLALNNPLLAFYGNVAKEKPWRKQYYVTYYPFRNDRYPSGIFFVTYN
jgi:alpha-mannosidase II